MKAGYCLLSLFQSIFFKIQIHGYISEPKMYFMPEVVLFDELFIEYVQTFFFKHPDQSFGTQAIAMSLPAFYRDAAMVSGAIHILLMRGMVNPVPLITDENGENIDKWIASKEAMANIKERERIERETMGVDLRLKQLNETNFYVPRNLSIASILVSFLALLAALANIYITLRKSKEPIEKLPQTNKKIIYSMPLSQKDSLNLLEIRGRKDSLKR
jgi:hypothetical protein